MPRNSSSLSENRKDGGMMRSRKYAVVLIVLLCLASFAFAALGSGGTEEESVEEVLEAVALAFETRNAEALAGFWIYPIERRT